MMFLHEIAAGYAVQKWGEYPDAPLADYVITQKDIDYFWDNKIGYTPYHPIPITRDLLLVCGFHASRRRKKDQEYTEYTHTDYLNVPLRFVDGVAMFGSLRMPYVHDFQRFTRAHCGTTFNYMQYVKECPQLFKAFQDGDATPAAPAPKAPAPPDTPVRVTPATLGEADTKLLFAVVTAVADILSKSDLDAVKSFEALNEISGALITVLAKK
jgi:hypothetical protein